MLAYHIGGTSSLGPIPTTRLVVPPADRFWADPQVVLADGQYHVFFEEFIYRRNRGHIATMRLGPTGPLDGSRVVLAGNHHLSYPFVFAFEGEWHMIPESAEANRIDLFRAEAFPYQWVPVRTLLDDVRAVDTNLVEHEGRWWMFTTLFRLPGETSMCHLYLFSSEHPTEGEWAPHPANPIASGAAGARSAGTVLRRDGRLLRVSQDSRELYGGRVELSEIVSMTRDEYRERPAGTLDPNRARGFFGLHTVSQVGDLTIVDLCRWRARF